jgi:hypothetical protein
MKFPTDEEMLANRKATRPYTAVILTKTAKRAANGADAIVWEHGRRNYALRAAGKLGELVADPESLLPGRCLVRDVRGRDPGEAGAGTHPLHHGIHSIRRALEGRFDRAIRPVSHPAVHAASFRGVRTGIAKANTLHPAAHLHPATNHAPILTPFRSRTARG